MPFELSQIIQLLLKFCISAKFAPLTQIPLFVLHPLESLFFLFCFQSVGLKLVSDGIAHSNVFFRKDSGRWVGLIISILFSHLLKLLHSQLGVWPQAASRRRYAQFPHGERLHVNCRFAAVTPSRKIGQVDIPVENAHPPKETIRLKPLVSRISLHVLASS